MPSMREVWQGVQVHNSVSSVISGNILCSISLLMEFLPVWSTLRSSALPADRLSMHALPPCIFFFPFDVLILFSFRNKNNCSESPSYDYQARTPPITTKSDTLSRTILPSLSASSSIEYQPDLKRRSYSLEDYRVKIPSMMDLTCLNSIPPVKK